LTDQAALLALIEPVVADMGLALVRVQLKGGKGSATLQIMAEDPATGQLGIGVCAKLSRRLSDVLDEADPIEEEYALEVSSPGIDRPLTRLHDWDVWKTHDVRVKLTAPLDGRKHVAGVIKGLDGDAAIITVPGAGDIRVPLAAMSGAKLVLTNRLINATRPLDMSDADDILEDDDDISEDDGSHEGSANDNDED
jgi:ribosome maturation factor RimP